VSKLFPIRSSSGDQEEREPELLELDDDRTDEVFDALGSETARQILLELHEGPQPASDLAAAVDTSIQNVQYHLTKLEAADLVAVADTWYAENGAEMDVYAPTDEALVLFAGTEPERSLRKLLKRLIGVLAPVALGVTALWLWLDDAGVPESEPSDSSGDAPLAGDGGDSGDGGSGAGDGGDGGDGSVGEDGDGDGFQPDTDPVSGTDSGGADGSDGGTGMTGTDADPPADVATETPNGTATDALDTETPNGTATDALDTVTAVGDAVATPALDLAGGLGTGAATLLGLGAALAALGVVALVRRRDSE